MANLISHDEDLRKHEERKNPDPRAQRSFGIVKGISYKIDRTKPATVFCGQQTMIFEDYQRKFELQKSKAIMHAATMQTRLI